MPGACYLVHGVDGATPMKSQIVIVGGGPVGLALALAASALPGVIIDVIERGPASSERLPEPFDHRVYALSPASLDFLNNLGVVLPPARLGSVRAMQVHGDRVGETGRSQIHFNTGQLLATIVEHAAIMHALELRLIELGRVNVHRDVSPTRMQSLGGNRREILLSDGRRFASDLLVAADGGHSRIRELAGFDVAVTDYDSDGVVANFSTEHHPGDIARQWFTTDAVLAYLPLPGNHISIVWSLNTATSKALPIEDADAFCRAVGLAGHQSLGTLRLVSPVARFPLARTMVKNWVAPGLALIGDAAHTVHPLAGQGVNLGFADVRSMVEVLRRRSMLSAIGDLTVLRRYERGARESAWAVGELTDRLRGMHLSERAMASWIRNDGMSWLNRFPVAKSLLINYASR